MGWFNRKNYVTYQDYFEWVTKSDRRMRDLENRKVASDGYVYDAMIMLLEEAGILIEDDKVGKGYVERNGIRYKIKKVK